VTSRVTKEAGLNRFLWDVRSRDGLALPPGAYQARLTVNGAASTQPFNLLIDPLIAEGGVTVADLVEQYDHNVRMRQLTQDVNQALTRVRDVRTRLHAANSPNAAKADALYDQMVATPEGIRYNKPGLQAHVQYLAGMTTGVDQKIGRDAIERYAELKKQLDGIKAELDKLGGGKP